MPLLQRLFNAPPGDWHRFFLFVAGIALFIGLAEWARHRRHWPAEVNRKLVHVGTGVLVLFSPVLFTSAVPLIWMAVLFVLVNTWGVATHRLTGMHDPSRQSYGTIFYPLAFLVLVALCWSNCRAVFLAAMAVLAFGDAAAALVGENLKTVHGYRFWRDGKSLEGSLAMAGVSLLAVFGVLAWREAALPWTQALLLAGLTALFTTALEAFSSRGSDNLTTPLGAALVLFIGLVRGGEDLTRLAWGMGLALATALLSIKARFLTTAGATATFILAAVVFGVGGWTWAWPILAFFVLSSLLSKAGKKTKVRFTLMFEKSSQRDPGQVLANGGVAGLCVILHLFWPHPAWFAAYLGALAAATADTWATEIGVFSRHRPRSILGLRPVEPGTSGGLSLLGTSAALAGALAIALVGWIVAPETMGWSAVIGVALAGLLASLVDSLLGATVQVQYRCPSCGRQTERQAHCNDIPTVPISGLRWMNNDWVNGLAAIFGALMAGIWTIL